jgi:hypothetical protein
MRNPQVRVSDPAKLAAYRARHAEKRRLARLCVRCGYDPICARSRNLCEDCLTAAIVELRELRRATS